jgi:hypothetical protein
MSWIIQYLLRNKESIKSAKLSEDIGVDSYDDLLVVESKIKELYEEGFLSDLDIYIIDLIADGRPIRELESPLGKNRLTISKTFVQICKRISYFLGGYFTDDGFLSNMKEQYKLNDTDIDKLKLFMAGKFKHKLMKRITQTNDNKEIYASL